MPVSHRRLNGISVQLEPTQEGISSEQKESPEFGQTQAQNRSAAQAEAMDEPTPAYVCRGQLPLRDG